MQNHLIIGLGGTGGKVIRSLRKSIFQNFSKTKPDGVNIGYLYVDSDDGMMAFNDPSWSVLGHSVQLGAESQLCIVGGNLRDRIDNIENHPRLRGWIGDKQQWNDILTAFEGVTVLGGQKRRLGRFLLACNAEALSEKINHQVSGLQHSSGQADVTFHVCCGLAGGTGSGCIIDVLVQIRKLYRYTNDKNRIIVYALLPEENPKKDWNTGNYHANGYAALLELNAMSVRSYRPYDITTGERTDITTPFNGMYVFSNKNEQNVILDVDKSVPDIIGDFLYQKIIAPKDIKWNELHRIENMENGDPSPENFIEMDVKIPQRSKSFIAFGIKRVSYPEDEIKEYLAYNFALQSALQLKFNHWDVNQGFVDEAEKKEYDTEVASDKAKNRWFLTNNHLCLSRGILLTDQKNLVRTIDEEWSWAINKVKLEVRKEDKKTWMENLYRLLENHFSKGFRIVSTGDVGGVQRFYDLKSRSRETMAQEIRHAIENELFDNWKNGKKSISDLLLFSTSLLDHLKTNQEEIDSLILAREEDVSYLQNECKKVEADFAKFFANKNNLFDKQAINLCKLYTAKTWGIALNFSKSLIDSVITQLRELDAELGKINNMLTSVVENFDTMCKERIQDDVNNQMQQHQLIRFFDPASVKEVNRKFVTDAATQLQCTSSVRNRILSEIGTNQSFASLTKLKPSSLIDVMLRQSEENAINVHDQYIENHTQDRLLRVNIIEKLENKYGGNQQALTAYIRGLVKHACNYLDFDNGEVQKQYPGITNAPTRASSFTVMLPHSPAHAGFINTLQTTFQESYPGGAITFLNIDNGKQNEIVIVNLTNLFPLRFVSQVAILREKYDQRIKAGGSRAKLEVHTEGDGSQFPNLYVPNLADIKQEAPPYLLMAKVMGLINVESDRSSPKFLLKKYDADGIFIGSTVLGEAFVNSIDNLAWEDVQHLKKLVQSKIDADFREKADVESLIKEIANEVNRIRIDECNGNENNAYFKLFNEGARKANLILRGRA